MMHREFWEEGLRIFGLQGAHKNKAGEWQCDCGRATCSAAFKHPVASNWQHTPDWDDEQIDAMELADQFATGFGVLCRGLLIVDVDARNGGVASFQKLSERVPEISGSGMIVNTGSGGGSRHLYFKAPEDCALIQHHDDYPGLDFKSSGYVVGPGSMHASGTRYTLAVGGPGEIEDAPQALVDMLRKPDRHRAEFDGRVLDVSHQDIADILAHIQNDDLDYEIWLRVGMAIHHATGGTGRDLWDAWSSTSAKHDDSTMDNRWHSFGRSANPVTIGTLIHHAYEAGWKMPVDFTPDPELSFDDYEDSADTLDIAGVDLTSPPGFAGVLARAVEDQSRRPRKRLSVAASLIALGNISGLRYTDDKDGVTTNLFAFCVAGSRTGKESIQQAIAELHRYAGMAPATHGAIKSEQEIVRNLIRHQAALYIVDEIGIFLAKIKNAQTKGGALYLDGVIGMLMAAYSKADGYMLLTGDAKEEVRAALMKEAGQIQKRLDAGDGGPVDERKLEGLQSALGSLDQGLDRPFLSLVGFTTPVTFDDLMDYQSATNGFIGRSLIFNERETAPRSKRGFRKKPFSDQIKNTLIGIAQAGSFDVLDAGRVQYYGKRISVPTDPRAVDMLDAVLDWMEDEAVAHKSRTGLEALYLGAYEIVSKVSLILAVPEGRRTVEHVRWAYAFVRRDLEEKARLVVANDREKDAPKQALAAKVANIIDGDGEALGVIFNRLRKFKREDVQAALANLEEKGLASKAEHQGARGKATEIWRLKS